MASLIRRHGTILWPSTILVTSLSFFLIGCNFEASKKKNTGKEVGHPSSAPEFQALAISKILSYEDSSISYDYKYTWAPIDERDPYGALFRTVIDSQKITSGNQIFLGIFDKYRTPPIRDSAFMDSNFANAGVQKELIQKYLANTDSTTRFEYGLNVKHKYVYINEDLLHKPRFELAMLPKKYVSKYCRISFSKPVISTDSTQCLIHMQNSCCRDGAIYFLSKSLSDWEVIKKAKASYPFIWSCD